MTTSQAEPETYEGEILDASERASSFALEAINRSEIDMQISTAKRYPRSVVTCTSKAKAMVCSSPEQAGECFYSMPRGGKRIEGPSIRMAEIIAMNYGNIRVATRPPVVGDKTVTVEWAAHDLESNYATTGSVSTNILDRNGNKYNQDMINVTCLATIAKARRNAIYAIVPGTLVKEVLQSAMDTATGGDMPIETRRERAMKYFRNFGISDERILGAVNRTEIEQLTIEDIQSLMGTANAIRDQMTTIDEAFPSIGSYEPKQSGASGVANKLKGNKGNKQPESGASTAGEEQVNDADESSTEPARWEKLVVLLSDVTERGEDACRERIADYAAKLHQADPAELDEKQLDALEAAIKRGDLPISD